MNQKERKVEGSAAPAVVVDAVDAAVVASGVVVATVDLETTKMKRNLLLQKFRPFLCLRFNKRFFPFCFETFLDSSVVKSRVRCPFADD